MTTFDRYGTNKDNPAIGQFQVSGTPWLSGSVISRFRRTTFSLS